jgi:methyltransferase (TIGR00027 family)
MKRTFTTLWGLGHNGNARTIVLVLVITCILTIGCSSSTKQSAGNSEFDEFKPSGTAMACLLLRAAAANDDREELRGPDYLAEKFLPENGRKNLKNPDYRRHWIRELLPMYAYIMARTLFFDSMMEQALNENVPQIVFLGAGFDSRPYRYAHRLRDTAVFELDVHATIQQKKQVLKQANIPLPANVTFVSIDFNTDTLADVLFKAGYKKNKRTLFIWEGVTFYITRDALDTTLNFIKSDSAPGSVVCFDYIALYSGITKSQAEYLAKLSAFMRSYFSAEPIVTRFREGEMEPYLKGKGYEILEHISGRDNQIQGRYLTLRDGTSIGDVPVVFNLVRARVLP